MLRVLELFSGIGACSKALTNLCIDYEIIDAVEIDKFAIKSFNAIHGTNFEPQDITKWDKEVGRIDLLMHGSPCQDFSLAGLGRGGNKGSGTRSSLMYESLRIIEKTRPHIVIWENVKAILSKKHRHNFEHYLETMEILGYRNTYQVLNAKDYGIPQNRERVFTVSISWNSSHINDLYKFPEPIPLAKTLKDVLDPEADEKYYLSDEKIKRMKITNWVLDRLESVKSENEEARTIRATNFKNPQCVKVGDLNIKGHDAIKRVYSPEGLSPTLTTMGGGNQEPKIIASRGRGEHNEQHIESHKDGLINTLTSVKKDNMVLESNFRVRKLTPKECWRLMGFSDEDFEKASKVNSNSQLYKQAGNSICVPVLEAILKNLLG